MKFRGKHFILAISFMGTMSAFAQQGQNAQVGEVVQQSQQSTFSDEELQKFATVYQELMLESQKVQQDLQGTIEKEGMEVQRFSEIQQASMSEDMTSDATETEMEQYQKIMIEVEKVQMSFNDKVEELIASNGFTTQKYEEIVNALQQDPALQQKLQQLMSN